MSQNSSKLRLGKLKHLKIIGMKQKATGSTESNLKLRKLKSTGMILYFSYSLFFFISRWHRSGVFSIFTLRIFLAYEKNFQFSLKWNLILEHWLNFLFNFRCSYCWDKWHHHLWLILQNGFNMKITLINNTPSKICNAFTLVHRPFSLFASADSHFLIFFIPEFRFEFFHCDSLRIKSLKRIIYVKKCSSLRKLILFAFISN